MTHTTERATTLLRSHPDLITTVEKTIADVGENATNREYLKWARMLLDRFPAEVQHSATKLQLEDTERMWTTLDGTAKALTSDNAALTSDNATLTNDVETLRNDNATLTNDNAALANDLAASKEENESLRALLSEGANGSETRASRRSRPREGERGEGGGEMGRAKMARK